MKTRLLNIWDGMSSGFWFLPALLVMSAAVLGFLIPILDANVPRPGKELYWLTTSAEGARAVLSAIAGAMITVAGVVFSVTMVTLSIASSQFGSRVLRRRTRDRATQLAIGAFLGTSVYCFMVLRTIQSTGGEVFVPHISVTLGIMLSVVGIFVLIYFIHDVAEAVQAPFVVARLAADLNDSIERLYPEELGQEHDGTEGGEAKPVPVPSADVGWIVESDQEGYIQAIDGESLLKVACQNDLLLELCTRPGNFITTGDPIAKVWGNTKDITDLDEAINDAFIVGSTRTPRQDVNCAIHELAQLTIRALSPGINDPFTAMNGIDRLSGALGRLARRKMPSKYRADENQQLRVIADHATFPETLAAAFNQIRQYAQGAPAVNVRLLEGLESIGRHTRREADSKAVLRQAKMVIDAFQDAKHLDDDLEGLKRQFERVLSALDQRKEPDSRNHDRAARRAGGDEDERLGSENSPPSQPPAEGEING